MSACLVCGCPARLPSHASAMCGARPRASVPPRSRLLRGLLRSPCLRSLLRFPAPCETPSQPQRCVARPPTRRLRDADERGPHFRPRRLCSHLRRARSDQDDQPAAGHAGARLPLHPLLRDLLYRPALHEELRPGQGNCDPSTPVSRCSVCIVPETRVPKPCIPYPGRGLRLRAGVRIRAIGLGLGLGLANPNPIALGSEP